MKTVFFIFGFIGSLVMIVAGINMIAIQSVSGGTVAEAFYNDFGWGFIGIGIFSAALLAMLYHHTSQKRPA